MSGTVEVNSRCQSTWTATKATLVVDVFWIVLNDEDYRWGIVDVGH